MASEILVCRPGSNSLGGLRDGALAKINKGAKIRNRNNQVSHLTQDTRHRGYPGTGIVEGDFTHNPEDWNNNSIKLKCGETF